MNSQLAKAEDRASALIKSEDFSASILSGLPEWVDADRFRTAALVALTDPEVAATSVRSQVEAVMACAQMGLTPGADRHVYLFPRKGKLCADPSARGFRFLAERQPGIKSVEAYLVRVGDVFEAVPDPANPGEYVVTRHESAGGFFGEREIKFAPTPDKSGCLGGYVKVTMEDGTTRFHRVPWATIWRNANLSRSNAFWSKWTAEMAEKTLLRDAWSRGALRGTGSGGRLGLAIEAHDAIHGVEDKPQPSKANDLLKRADKPAPAPEPDVYDIESHETDDSFVPDDEPPFSLTPPEPDDSPDYANMNVHDLIASIAGKWNVEFDSVLESCVTSIKSRATSVERMTLADAERARAWCLNELGVVL